MSYQIIYTPDENEKYPKNSRTKNRSHKYWILLLLSASALCIKLYGIPDFLIPGNKEITKSAVQTMILDLRSGESLDDAITGFCMEIIHSAK